MTHEPARAPDRSARALLAWLLGGWVVIGAMIAVAACAAWVLGR
jgi:hypothetical protein